VRPTLRSMGDRVITLEQYRVLNVCVDDVEPFYVPFAELNYGGQVFPRSAGPNCARYVDDKEWTIQYSGEDVAENLAVLIRVGLLHCWRVSDAPSVEPEIVANLEQDEFGTYAGYSCLTFDDHVERYGFGPHQFKTTELGLREIQKDEYRLFDDALGWT
jgi:hypothetical protein